MPSINECWPLMNPAAGVTPARPDIAPFIIAVIVGFPFLFQLRNTHKRAHEESPIWVKSKALAERAPDAKALPALNPNQPSHSNAPPIAASGILWGTMICGP